MARLDGIQDEAQLRRLVRTAITTPSLEAFARSISSN